MPRYFKTCIAALALLVVNTGYGQTEHPQFQQQSYCKYRPVFGIADTANSQVWLVRSDFTFGVFDTVPAATITGIAGFIGSGISKIIFSGADSVHICAYGEKDYELKLESRESYYIPNEKITVFRGSYPSEAWILIEQPDTALLISREEEPDTLGLGLHSNARIFYNLTDQRYIHITGHDANDSVRYYQFDRKDGTIIRQYYIDTLPGELLYVSGMGDFNSYFITQDSNVLYVTNHLYNADSFYTLALDTIDSVAAISNWNLASPFTTAPSQIAIAQHIDTANSLIYTYAVKDWVKLDTLSRSFYILDILFAMEEEYYNSGRAITYRDASGKLYLTHNIDDIYNNNIQIPTDIVAYSISWYCWSSVDEHEWPYVDAFVYPNPATDRFNIIIKNVPCEKEHNLELLDMYGKVLYQTPFYSKCDITVPADDLAPGMYLLKLHIDGQVHTRKVIKASGAWRD